MAAEQFRVDVSRADGKPVRSRHYDYDLMGVSGIVPDGPAMSQFAAQARVKAAWRAVRGPTNDAWVADVRLVLLGLASLQTVDAHYGWKDHGRRSRARHRAGAIDDILLQPPRPPASGLGHPARRNGTTMPLPDARKPAQAFINPPQVQ